MFAFDLVYLSHADEKYPAITLFKNAFTKNDSTPSEI